MISTVPTVTMTSSTKGKHQVAGKTSRFVSRVSTQSRLSVDERETVKLFLQFD